jgi:hypothetical protein
VRGAVVRIRLARTRCFSSKDHEDENDRRWHRHVTGWKQRKGPSLDAWFLRWDNPTVILTLDEKRRLSVPASLAPTKPGDHFKGIVSGNEKDFQRPGLKVFKPFKGTE